MFRSPVNTAVNPSLKALLLLVSVCLTAMSYAQEKVLKQIKDENGKIFLERVQLSGSDTILDRVYYPNGQVQYVYPLLGGTRNGLALGYYEDGTLMFEETYQNDKRHGTSRLYKPDGSLSHRHTFTDGMYTDTSFYYLPDGSLQQTVLYLQPCPEKASNCIKTITLYRQNQKVYSYQEIRGQKSGDHQVFNRPLYDQVMKEQSEKSNGQKGREIYRMNCIMCHRMEKPMIGPPLGCITKRMPREQLSRTLKGANGHNKVYLSDAEMESLMEFLKASCN